MKKTFALFLACMFVIVSFAQSYKPVLSEGKSWKSSYTLVEGIGKDKLIRSFNWGTECRYATMVACYENGQKIFDESDFGKIDTGLSHVSYAGASCKESLFNLAGQQVGKNYKGIVIQGGKKICR